MDKSQMKKVIKPLIKECLKEIMLEDGVLSSVISECVRGALSAQQLVFEQRQPQPLFQENFSKKPSKRQEYEENDLDRRAEEKRKQTLIAQEEQRMKILQKTGLPQVFQGLQPSVEDDEPTKTEKTSIQEATDPNPARNGMLSDAGVDLSGIVALVGGTKTWKKAIK